MYSNILITHRIVVTIFLLHYVVKFVLMAFGKKDQLISYTKITRIPEMIVSVLFLITGGWMLVNTASLGVIMIVKLVCVFAAIPLAIIGFKRNNKMLAALSVILIILAYGFAEMNKKAKAGGKVDTSTIAADPMAVGKTVYSQSCINCHGADGKLGLGGAKDLSITQLSLDEQKAVIRKGKNAMPGYKDLTDDQVNGVVEYLGTLRPQH
ncbi:MAG: cytochrome c, mono- and diheme variant family [Bacteroidota bacterium]|nr:cytochrome c, mono- and diheme variant family [Bacteroidota bacterium]